MILENKSKERKNSEKNTYKLFKEYSETKNKEVRNKIIRNYLYIPEILAKKYVNKGIDYDDLFQIASLGLMYAIERFDFSKGYEFASFATPTILGEIKRYFRDKEWLIRVPRRIQELSKKINKAKEILNLELMRAPTVRDISIYLQISEEEVIEAIEGSYAYSPKSLDMKVYANGEDKELSLNEILGEIDYDMIKIENKDYLKKAFDKLNDFEKKIIIDRFFHNKPQSKIAQEANVSQMTISRMEKKIIEKLKEEVV